MQDFNINPFGSMFAQPEQDPNKYLIPKEMIGVRNTNKTVLKFLTIFSGTLLIITLSEKIAVLRILLWFLLSAGVLFGTSDDVIKRYAQYNFVSASYVVFCFLYYLLIAGFLFGFGKFVAWI